MSNVDESDEDKKKVVNRIDVDKRYNSECNSELIAVVVMYIY